MLEVHFPINHTETDETLILFSDVSNKFFIVDFDFFQTNINEFYIPYDNQKNIDVLKENKNYLHYKGDIYQTFFTANHFLTQDKFVIYTKDSDSQKSIYWARPYDMFHGFQILEDGTKVKRFTLTE